MIELKTFVDRGKCVTSPDPDAYLNDSPTGKHQAREMCSGCLVIDECLMYALESGMTYGVWGGTTGPQREEMLKHGDINRIYLNHDATVIPGIKHGTVYGYQKGCRCESCRGAEHQRYLERKAKKA